MMKTDNEIYLKFQLLGNATVQMLIASDFFVEFPNLSKFNVMTKHFFAFHIQVLRQIFVGWFVVQHFFVLLLNLDKNQ